MLTLMSYYLLHGAHVVLRRARDNKRLRRAWVNRPAARKHEKLATGILHMKPQQQSQCALCDEKRVHSKTHWCSHCRAPWRKMAASSRGEREHRASTHVLSFRPGNSAQVGQTSLCESAPQKGCLTHASWSPSKASSVCARRPGSQPQQETAATTIKKKKKKKITRLLISFSARRGRALRPLAPPRQHPKSTSNKQTCHKKCTTPIRHGDTRNKSAILLYRSDFFPL